MDSMTGQLRGLVGQLSLSQRIWIGAAAIGSIVLLVVFVSLAGQPSMEPVFTKLSANDAGSISAALRTAKIQFQVTDAGATILVPTDKVSDARVAAAQAGVGAGSSADGFSLFDKSGFGTSEFDQQVTYQRAIQTELEATIESMAGVDSARVAIVQAQQGLFTDQDKPATASVLIQMKNGESPSASMVRGITTAVSGAVAGLTPENVTVVDQQGRVLSGTQDATSVGAAEAQQSVERNAETAVKTLLDQALGAGHASVTVAATMDFNKIEQEITSYQPVSTGAYTPVSVHTVDENYGPGTSPGVGGIPGSQSNVPGLPTYPGNVPAASAAPSSPAPSASPGASASPAPSASPAASGSPAPSASAATSSGSGYTHHEETVNYSLSQTVQHIVQEPGVVKRLSVAVLVDQASLNGMTTDALKTSVSAAVGADPTRGDVVAIQAVTFAKAPTVAAPAADMMGDIFGYVRSAAGIVVALLLLFFVWRNMRALQRRSEDVAILALHSGPASFPAYNAAGQPAQLAAGEAPAELPQESAHTQIQERLRTVAEQRPDALVNLMNSWMLEDQKRR